jgi:glycosyltransferase involved in cell wall biosynthesis
VRPLRLAGHFGQSAAMQAGFDHARAPVVVTMDGDLQNDAADIPALVDKLAEGYDIVAGYRQDRQDRLLTRRLPSWAANRLLVWATGVELRDTGCSLKAYRRDVLDRFRLYADLHRFIPALAAALAGARIAEVAVRHHPRARGASKYGLGRVGAVLADLFTIKLIRSFRATPLVYFGVGALLALEASALVLLAAFLAGVDSLVPLGVCLTFAMLAAYLLMLGLTAEVTIPHRHLGPSRTGPLVRDVTAPDRIA